MNRAKYAALPDDLKKVIDETMPIATGGSNAITSSGTGLQWGRPTSAIAIAFPSRT